MDDVRGRPGCPERMVFGPCGGVRDDERCEVAEHRCEDEVRRLLAAAGLGLLEIAAADLGDSPPEWSERADAVDAEVERRHGDDPRWAEAQEQSRRVGRLLTEGALRPWLGVAVAG